MWISDPHDSLKGMGGGEVVSWGQGPAQSPPSAPSSTLFYSEAAEGSSKGIPAPASSAWACEESWELPHMPEGLAPVWLPPHL